MTGLVTKARRKDRTMDKTENRTVKPVHSRKNFVTAVVANDKGEIFDLHGYAAAGMAGPSLIPLTLDDTIPMPFGGELMMMPDRKSVLYNIGNHRFEILDKNPYTPGEPIFPVAAFNSPGFVISYVCAYREKKAAGYLPLFSYGAVGWHKGKFRSAAIRVDRERRQDLRWMKPEDVVAGIADIQKKMPDNRLETHLENAPWNTAVRQPRTSFWEGMKHRYRRPHAAMHVVRAVCPFRKTVKSLTARPELISRPLLQRLLRWPFFT